MGAQTDDEATQDPKFTALLRKPLAEVPALRKATWNSSLAWRRTVGFPTTYPAVDRAGAIGHHRSQHRLT